MDMKQFGILSIFTALVVFQLAIACLMTLIANALDIKYMAWVALALWMASIVLCIYFLSKNSMVRRIVFLSSPGVSLLLYLVADVVFHIFR